MTIELTRPESSSSWTSRPGWDIVADMTPPELVTLRRLSVLRRRIGAALVMVLVLCSAGYVFAMLQQASAEAEAASATDQTTALTRTTARYAGITRIESTVTGLDAQIATLMQGDVDVARAVARIRQELPGSMSIQNISVTLNSANSTAGEATLDAAGRPTIGTVSVSGEGRSLDDLPAYVEALAKVRGFVNVLPTSNEVTKGISQFSITLDLNDLLHTHRYVLTTSRSK